MPGLIFNSANVASPLSTERYVEAIDRRYRIRYDAATQRPDAKCEGAKRVHAPRAEAEAAYGGEWPQIARAEKHEECVLEFANRRQSGVGYLAVSAAAGARRAAVHCTPLPRLPTLASIRASLSAPPQTITS
jgi:hypothetical protein